MTKVFYTAWIIFIIIILAAFVRTQSGLLNREKSLYFNEFVQSINFTPLLNDSLHSFSYRLAGGTYNIGLPFSPQKETVFGTQRGSRALPFLVLVSSLQNVFGALWDRIYLILILSAPVMGFIGANLFFRTTRNPLTLTVATIIFAFNPWVFSRIQTGFWQLHLAYAAIPFIYLYFMSLLNEKESLTTLLNTKAIRITTTILLLSITYAFQPHFLIMLALPLSIAYLFTIPQLSRAHTHSLAREIGIIAFGFFMATTYHLVPALLNTMFSISIPGQDLTLAAVNFNGQGSRIVDALKLTPVGPLSFHTYTLSPLDYLSYGFVICALMYFIAAFWKASSVKNHIRKSGTYMLFAFVSLFLAKGINEPFIDLSKSIYTTFVMRSFRDPSRFYSMIAFALSMVIVSSHIRSKRLNMALSFVALTFLIPTTLALSSNAAKSLSLQEIPCERYELFDNDVSPARAMLLPQNIPLSFYKWHVGDASGVNNSPVDALIPLVNHQASYTGFMDSYFNQLNMYATSKASEDKDFEHLWSRMLVGEVIVDSGLKKSALSQTPLLQISRSLGKRDGFSLHRETSEIQSYTPANTMDYITDQQPIFVAGDLQTFDSVSQKSGTRPVILLNQPVNAHEFKNGKVVKQKIVYEDQDQLNTLFLESLDQYSTHLEKVVWENDTPWSLHEAGLYAGATSGLLHTSGRSIEPKQLGSSITVDGPVTSGKYVAAVRLHIASADTQLRITINGKQNVLRFDDRNQFTWKILGPYALPSSSDIVLTTERNRNVVVDEMLLIPQDVFIREKNQHMDLLTQNTTIPLSTFTSEKSKSSASFIQTEYDTWDINSGSRWITMRTAFENGWEISDMKAKFVGDYYGMTFLTTGSQGKKIQYRPERTFSFFLYVSTLTSIFCAGILVYSIKKHYKL